MKNFSTRKRLSAPVAPTLAVMAALLSSACDRDERPVSSSTGPEVAKTTVHDISARNIAKMLAELPMTLTQAREVYQGVCSSSSNGYDEEYPFSNLVTCPGTGVGDDLLQTRSKAEHSEPLRDLLLSAVEEDPVTRAGTPSRVQIPNRAAGIMISRRKLYLSTSKLNNDMISASASIIPITIIEKAVLQFPMVVIVFVMTSGGFHCDIIRASPAKQAIMHG